MVSQDDIFADAKCHDFSRVPAWLFSHSGDVNRTCDYNGVQWTLLHFAARAEAEGRPAPEIVEALLRAGADPHLGDRDKGSSGDTPFNIAAGASPLTGRLMTNHWFALALAGKGPKGINDTSGSHGSTLPQYIAKWSNKNEIESQLAQGCAKGMSIAVQNKSGWTPLHAAAAMGREHAVRAFAARYSRQEKDLRTIEMYTAPYGVVFPAGATATDIARARLTQDKNLDESLARNLRNCIAAIAKN